jgi:hypothetical protein
MQPFAYCTMCAHHGLFVGPWCITCGYPHDPLCSFCTRCQRVMSLAEREQHGKNCKTENKGV